MKKILLLKGMHAGKITKQAVWRKPQRLIAMRERKKSRIYARAAEFDCCIAKASQPWFRSGSYGPFRPWLLHSACVGAGTRGALEKYLAAIIEAQRWLMAPSTSDW